MTLLLLSLLLLLLLLLLWQYYYCRNYNSRKIIQHIYISLQSPWHIIIPTQPYYKNNIITTTPNITITIVIILFCGVVIVIILGKIITIYIIAVTVIYHYSNKTYHRNIYIIIPTKHITVTYYSNKTHHCDILFQQNNVVVTYNYSNKIMPQK